MSLILQKTLLAVVMNLKLPNSKNIFPRKLIGGRPLKNEWEYVLINQSFKFAEDKNMISYDSDIGVRKDVQ